MFFISNEKTLTEGHFDPFFRLCSKNTQGLECNPVASVLFRLLGRNHSVTSVNHFKGEINHLENKGFRKKKPSNYFSLGQNYFVTTGNCFLDDKK